MVDWKKGAEGKSYDELEAYHRATKDALIVAKDIANFIAKNNIEPSTVTCIGHSLGQF